MNIRCFFILLLLLVCVFDPIKTEKEKETEDSLRFLDDSNYKDASGKVRTAIHKFKKAVHTIIAFKNNKKYEKLLKEKPGLVKRFFRFISSPFSSAPSPSNEEAVKKRVDASIQMKTAYLEEIFATYKSQLTYDLKMRIAYYVGSQNIFYFEAYKDKAIKQAIEKFIKAANSEQLDKEYYTFLKKILYLHEEKTHRLVSHLDLVYLDVTTNYNEEFQSFFEKKELARFGKLQVQRMLAGEDLDPQLLLDSVKKNLDYVNSKAKTVLSKYDKVSKMIKSNEMLKSLRNAFTEVDNAGHLNIIKKATAKGDIISGIIKIEQGTASAKDVVNIADKVLKECGVSIFKTPIDIARNVLEVKEHFENLKNSKDAAKSIAELLLVSANVAALSPNPIHQTLGKYLNIAGNEINQSKAIQNIINESVESSVNSYERANGDYTLHFNTQFFSDFAMDAFSYDPIKIKTDFTAILKEKYGETFDSIKGVISDYNDDVADAIADGRIDRFASITNDFADDTTLPYTREEAWKSVSSVFENVIDTTDYSSDDFSDAATGNSEFEDQFIEDALDAGNNFE